MISTGHCISCSVKLPCDTGSGRRHTESLRLETQNFLSGCVGFAARIRSIALLEPRLNDLHPRDVYRTSQSVMAVT